MLIGPKKGKVICSVCKKQINGARTVIDNAWFCADCTYKYDFPEVEIPPRQKRFRLPKQRETLFDTEHYARNRDRG